MAHIELFVFMSVFLLCIGSTPSRSKECNQLNFNKCSIWNDNADVCRSMRESYVCLENIDKNCSDSDLAERIALNINIMKAAGAPCPGLQNGKCLYEALKECEHKIPSPCYIDAMTGEARKNHCPSFKRKVAVAKDLCNDVKCKCRQLTSGTIDIELSDMERVESICAEEDDDDDDDDDNDDDDSEGQGENGIE